MSPKELVLDFHGVAAVLRSEDGALLSDLERDFAWFAGEGRRPGAPAGTVIELELRVSAEAATARPSGVHWRWRSARVYPRGASRTVDYEGRARLDYDSSTERGVLAGADRSLLHELAYLAVLSRVGAALDRRGLHRVHALGFTYRGRGGLLLLPSGGGKSRLSLELLGRADFGLLSDEIPVLAGGGRELAAFPLRLGLRGEDGREIPERFVRPFQRRRFGPKRLVDVEYFRDSIRPAAPLTWVLVGGRSRADVPSVVPCSRSRAAAALAASLVLGLGTPQVLELLVPSAPYLRGALGLAAVAASRARSAARAAGRARCLRFLLGGGPRASADALESFLASEPCASSS